MAALQEEIQYDIMNAASLFGRTAKHDHNGSKWSFDHLIPFLIPN